MTEVESREYQPQAMVPGSVYRVIRLIGAGGMGTVYDVEDTTVGKRYVLKTLHPELSARADLARRMEQEARALARLSHPNIVEVVTAGVTTDALCLPFYVMEKLNGQNLRTLLQKKKTIEVPLAVHIGIDLLDALDCAHEKGVIHRDVKPDNIFLHTNNGTTITKLLDFGISRYQGDTASSTTGRRFVGTLRYAAPEQLQGEPVSPQTDLYSAGLVIYEMISGRGPFDYAVTPAEIGHAHIHDAAPLLVDHGIVVPQVLETLLSTALAKDPAKRARDAFTFAAQLRSLLQTLQKDRKPDRTGGTTVAGILQGAESMKPSSPRIIVSANQDENASPAASSLALAHTLQAETRASTPAAKMGPEEVTHTAFGMPPPTLSGTPPGGESTTMVSPGESMPAHDGGVVDRSAETRSAAAEWQPGLGPAGTEPFPLEALQPASASAPCAEDPAAALAESLLVALPAPGAPTPGTDVSAVSTVSPSPTQGAKRSYAVALVAAVTFAIVAAGALGVAVLLLRGKSPAIKAVTTSSSASASAPLPASASAAPMLATPLFDEIPSATAPLPSPVAPVAAPTSSEVPSAASSAAPSTSVAAPPNPAPGKPPVAQPHDESRPRAVRVPKTPQPSPAPIKKRPGSGL